jgi:hypothetical protein
MSTQTNHNVLPENIKEIIRQMVRETMRNSTIDEMNVTGNVDGYGTPFAFGKGEDEKTKGKRQADLTGYSVVKENRWVALIKEATANANILGIDFNISETDFRIFFAFKDKKEASIKVRQIGSNKIVNLIQNSLDKAYGKGEFFFRSGTNSEMQNGYLFQKKENNIDLSKLKFESNKSISENRWVALRQEDSTPTQKIGRGISNINKQLKEMEQFLSWYGKIKNENGVSNKNFWKRTNSHIYNIKERLLKLDQQIRKISE